MLHDLLPLATYCALMSLTPGPNNVMLTSSGANFGLRRTLPHILGIQAGGALQTFACCLGIGALFSAHPALLPSLRVVAAAYLAWMALRLLRLRPGTATAERPLTAAQAALFQAVNPKSWMKAVTIAALFVPASLPPVQGALLVSAIGALVGLPCVSTWAVFGQAIRRSLERPGRLRIFNLSMAAMLGGLAITFLV
jgi:threonine/homoserine/homoserine lactone efflux protein